MAPVSLDMQSKPQHKPIRSILIYSDHQMVRAAVMLVMLGMNKFKEPSESCSVLLSELIMNPLPLTRENA